MSEIAAASQEQSAGIEQVNQAITQMDTITQQNAALVEEAAASSESMQAQAQKLTELVGAFRLVQGAGMALQPQRAAVVRRAEGKKAIAAPAARKRLSRA